MITAKSFSRVFFASLLLLTAIAHGQAPSGRISGVVTDVASQPLSGANVRLVSQLDSMAGKGATKNKQTANDGSFYWEDLPDGQYKLWITAVGYRTVQIDSIQLEPTRRSFTLGDIQLALSSSAQLDSVVIVADRSLIQSKDGNMTFLAGDSPAAAGASASDLMTQVPLVNKDADGKLTVRGKEPKILIDDKPVELNMQQLQELLESMPGSSIEKIEVMTNPPPQFAQESAVINIVTRKGRVGRSGRVALSAGTRGEWSASGQYSYRKTGLSVQLNAAVNESRFAGDGYSNRQNIYADSSNQFNTRSDFLNWNRRPSFRAQLDYDWKKKHQLNAVIQYNGNRLENLNNTYFSNINRFGDQWRFSLREVNATGLNRNLSGTVTYTWRPKPGETLRLIAQVNAADNFNTRRLGQTFLFNDGSPTGQDSTQYQDNDTRIFGWNTRLNYDRMLVPKKTYLSTGAYVNHSLNRVNVFVQYLKKPEYVLGELPLLGQDFDFLQTIQQYRISIKQLFTEHFSLLAGTTYEITNIQFKLWKENDRFMNTYGNWLPFATLNRSWRDRYNLTLSYKRTIRRPGLGELNPTVDFSDPYNIRYGNPDLIASTAHNFDLVGGWNRTGRFLNIGFGHNIVQDVFNQVRSLADEGKTILTWENISNRKEWEVSIWNGFPITKKLKINSSASYVYNLYGSFDRLVRRFQNGGSLTSTVGMNYIPHDRGSFSGQFNLNRFATPQGFARWNASLNLGAQWKFLQKRLVVSLNTIDPIRDQRRYSFTYGPNFNLESFSRTRTRNYRITLAWSIQPKPKTNPLNRVTR